MSVPAPSVAVLPPGDADVEVHSCPAGGECGWSYPLAADTATHRADAAKAFDDHWTREHAEHSDLPLL